MPSAHTARPPSRATGFKTGEPSDTERGHSHRKPSNSTLTTSRDENRRPATDESLPAKGDRQETAASATCSLSTPPLTHQGLRISHRSRATSSGLTPSTVHVCNSTLTRSRDENQQTAIAEKHPQNSAPSTHRSKHKRSYRKLSVSTLTTSRDENRDRLPLKANLRRRNAKEHQHLPQQPFNSIPDPSRIENQPPWCRATSSQLTPLTIHVFISTLTNQGRETTDSHHRQALAQNRHDTW
jgi:hypothetical protein